LSAKADDAYAALKQGTVDWSLAPAAQTADAKRRFGGDEFAPYTAVVFYGFNLQAPVFANAKFREAIVHAINPSLVADRAYHGGVTAIHGPVGQGVVGAQPDPCGVKCRYNPGAARSLVKAAYPSGSAPTINIDFDEDPTDTTQRTIASLLQAELRVVGIRAELRPHAFSEYGTFLAGGTAELFRLGWVAAEADAGGYLEPLFRSGASTNLTGYTTAAVDKMLDTARSSNDAAVRIENYRRAESTVMSLLPIVPLVQFQTLAVGAKKVRGLKMNVLGSFDGSAVWLSTKS
jgi:ABC-type transport system substrate-binding protein